jgi:hypothetical protein
MANWQSVFLYYEPEKFCKLCGAKADIYKWPDSMAMNDSATGCLKCLHRWFEHRNPASEAKPQEFHNRKPILVFSSDLNSLDRHKFHCEGCDQIVRGFAKLRAHQKGLHHPLTKDKKFYIESVGEISDITKRLQSAIDSGDVINALFLASFAAEVLENSHDSLKSSSLSRELEKLFAKAKAMNPSS